MMKMLKKIMAVALILAMVLTLGACSKDPKDALVGTWETEFNFASIFNDAIAESGDPALTEYLKIDSFTVKVILTFNEDDTYAMSLDEDSLNASISKLKSDLCIGMENYMKYMLSEMGIQMPVEDFLAASGLSIEDLVNEAITDDMVRELVADSYSQGKYRVDEEKIYLSAGLEYEVDTESYETYKIDGKTMIWSDSTSEDPAMVEAMYPLTFTKIS